MAYVLPVVFPSPACKQQRSRPSQLNSPACLPLLCQAVAVVAMLEKRAGEELFRKHVSTVVAAGLAALAAEQAAAAGKEAPAASAGAAGAAAAAAAAGGAAAQGDGGAGAAAAGSRLLDTMAFLNDLGRWAEGRIITQVLLTGQHMEIA